MECMLVAHQAVVLSNSMYVCFHLTLAWFYLRIFVMSYLLWVLPDNISFMLLHRIAHVVCQAVVLSGSAYLCSSIYIREEFLCVCVYGMARARVVQVGCMIVNKAISFGGA